MDWLFLSFLQKQDFSVPKKIWDFGNKETWDVNWTGSIPVVANTEKHNLSLFKAWVPLYPNWLIISAFQSEIFALKRLDKIGHLCYLQIYLEQITLKFEALYNPGIMPFTLIALVCIPLFQ